MTKCLMFPGQGAQHPLMFEEIRNAPLFNARYDLVCDILQSNPLKMVATDPSYLNQNLVSSVITVFISTLSLDLYTNYSSSPVMFEYLGGYSVGQLTALYAAKALSFEQMLQLLKIRAECMNECIRQNPSGMIAVIGVAEADLINFCRSIQAAGYYLTISNYNAVGQYTLAGTELALQQALMQLDILKPKQYQRIPVSGAWHCDLLRPASKIFYNYLAEFPLKLPQFPVLDNVTGKFLPNGLAKLKKQLAVHLCSPVYWKQGIQYLIDKKCKHFIEVGYGNTLTKFGYFIDRTLTHETFYSNIER